MHLDGAHWDSVVGPGKDDFQIQTAPNFQMPIKLRERNGRYSPINTTFLIPMRPSAVVQSCITGAMPLEAIHSHLWKVLSACLT